MGFFRRGRDYRPGGEAERRDASPWATEPGLGVGAAEAATEIGDLGRPARLGGDPVSADTDSPPAAEETGPATDENRSTPALGSFFRSSRRETRMISTSLQHDGHAETCIGAGSHIVGTLNFEATVRIEGNVEGDISAQESIVIGDGAVVKAQLTADTIVVTGKVTGDLVARCRVEIRAPGELHGNITTPSLVIHDGVVFEGKCSMGRIAKESTSRITKPYKNGNDVERAVANP